MCASPVDSEIIGIFLLMTSEPCGYVVTCIRLAGWVGDFYSCLGFVGLLLLLLDEVQVL